VASNTRGDKSGETKRLKADVTENNLWVSKTDLKSYVTEGAEQKVYFTEDGLSVIKTNAVVFYASWKDY